MSDFDLSPVPDYEQLLNLKGKNYIVLGGGYGMGRQACHALSRLGAGVFCVDIDADRAAAVAKEIGGSSWAGDITKRAGVESLFTAATEQMGAIYGVVDIVGQAAWSTVDGVDDQLWDQQFDINLRHAYLISQVAAPHFQENGGGVMVFIASVSGIVGAPNHSAYGAAKAGLMSLVRSLSVELGPLGIRVNAVAPGVILTPRVQAMTTEAQRQVTADNAPLQRNGVPADIASAVLYLSSPLSGYVSGQTLVVDGAVSAKFPYPSGS